MIINQSFTDKKYPGRQNWVKAYIYLPISPFLGLKWKDYEYLKFDPHLEGEPPVGEESNQLC